MSDKGDAAVAAPARLWATGYVPHSGQDVARAAIAVHWPEMHAALRDAVAALPPICWRCGEDITPGVTANYPAREQPSHGTCPRDMP